MKRMILLAMVLALAIVAAAPALADMGIADPQTASEPLVSATVPPVFIFDNAKHVVNGAALRNKYSATIPLRGVPVGGSVVSAILYWNFSDKNVSGPVSKALFNGNLVTGTLVANNADPCWSLTGNHTYRAVVTSFVPGAAPNQDYEVVLVTPKPAKPVSTGGENPWATLATIPNLEGASLIVVYTGSSTSGARVAVYDAMSGTEFSSTLALTLLHPAAGLVGSGVMSMTGADGQRGSGHNNSVSNETTFFNGVQIAGPGGPAGSSPNSEWDGSAAWPLEQLWDVHTNLVSFAGTTSLITWNSFGDCLVPVAVVLQQGLND